MGCCECINSEKEKKISLHTRTDSENVKIVQNKPDSPCLELLDDSPLHPKKRSEVRLYRDSGSKVFSDNTSEMPVQTLKLPDLSVDVSLSSWKQD